MQTVVITGGTGFVGKNLTQKLIAKNYKVIILSRNKTIQSQQQNVSFAYWNVDEQLIDETAIENADFIIHLAGAGIAEKRWTKKRKQEIIDSRTKSSNLLITTLKKINHKPKAIISASAIGWYGENKNDIPFTENNLPANDFLGNTCKQWEDSISKAQTLGIRVVKLRTGIVLSKYGGALKEFIKPIKWCIAPILGSGKQIISWIHIDDLCNQYMYAMEHEKLQGSYNAVAPTTINHKNFMLALAQKIKGKFYMPIHVPTFLLKIILGEMSIEILKSTYVSSKKIEQSGFQFQYKTIQEALENLLS